MSVIAAALRELMAAGLDGEALVAAVERIEAASAPAGQSRTPRQERNRRYYETKGRLKASEKRLNASEPSEQDAASVSASPEPPPPSVPTPFTPLKGGVSPAPTSSAAGQLPKAAAFARFWEAYPLKVGKRSAETAFERAVRRVAAEDPLGVILGGLARCRRSKAWQCEIKFLPHPTTWLNRDGWEDEPDGPAVAAKAAGPIHFTPEQRAAQLRHFEDTGEWREAWGPRPQPTLPLAAARGTA